MFWYKIGISFLSLGINIGALFIPKLKLRKNGQLAFKRLNKTIPKWNKKDFVVWIHAPSLGEFEQAIPIIEKIKTDFPTHKILLSFFSPSGYEAQKNYFLADLVTYLPLDSEKNAKEFIAYYQPKLAIFIKYDFWYYFYKQCKESKIPLFCVSTLFRSSQSFFTNKLKFNNVLNFVTHFFVQNEESKKLLKKINLNNSTVSGDTRFDRVLSLRDSTIDLGLIHTFASSQTTFVVGSSWQKDIEIIKDFILANPNIKTIIAPHEINPSQIKAIITILGVPCLLFSEIKQKDLENYNILIINKIGLLKHIYSIASFAYVGGGFGKGLHNILEASTFGAPVIFGPKYNKFKEAVDLIEKKGAFYVSNKNEFSQRAQNLLDTKFRKETSAINVDFVNQNGGATLKIIQHLTPYLLNEN